MTPLPRPYRAAAARRREIAWDRHFLGAPKCRLPDPSASRWPVATSLADVLERPDEGVSRTAFCWRRAQTRIPYRRVDESVRRPGGRAGGPFCGAQFARIKRVDADASTRLGWAAAPGAQLLEHVNPPPPHLHHSEVGHAGGWPGAAIQLLPRRDLRFRRPQVEPLPRWRRRAPPLTAARELLGGSGVVCVGEDTGSRRLGPEAHSGLRCRGSPALARMVEMVGRPAIRLDGSDRCCWTTEPESTRSSAVGVEESTARALGLPPRGGP